MKKNLLKSLLVAGLMAVSAGAWAQTDVTTTYIKNANFSLSTPIDNHLCGYGKDMEGHGTTYYGMQEVTDWTKVIVAGAKDEKGFENSGVAGAVFAYGSEWQLKGNSKTAPATDPNGAAGNALGFFAVWGNAGYYAQDVTLKAGAYTLTVPIYNQSGTQANESYTGFFPTEGTAYTVAVNPTVGQWSIQTVKFTLEADTPGQIRLGYKSTGSGSGANPMIFIDKVTLTWTDPADAPRLAWNEAKEAAETVLNDTAYQRITGAELAALQAEVAKAEPTTADAYTAAAKALEDATSTFIAAKPAYDAYVYLQQWVENDLNLAYAKVEKPAVGEAATNAEDAKAKTAALYVALRPYYESHALAEGKADAVDITATKMTNTIANESTGVEGWTDEGDAKIRLNGGESYTMSNGETVAKYFDSDNWGANAFSGTFTQSVTLPNGKYLLSVLGRGYLNGTYQLVAGENNATDIPYIGASGGIFDKGWNMVFLEFEINSESGEEAVNLGIKVNTDIPHSWISFNDFRLVQLSNVPTAIKNLNVEAQHTNAIYNLQGQQVKNAQKGLFIRDGKKYVVR